MTGVQTCALPIWIGARFRRLEDPPLLTGRGRYADDIRFPDLLHVAFVRSQHAHAAIRSIDVSKARALSGVFAVLTLDDLMPVLAKRRMVREPGQGGKPRESMWPYPLSAGEAAFVGEPIALVAAKNRYIAEDAASLVDIDYDVLPQIVVIVDELADLMMTAIITIEPHGTGTKYTAVVIHGDEAAHIFVVIDNGAFDGLSDRHRGRRRCAAGRLRILPTAGQC